MSKVTRFDGNFSMDRGAVCILDALGFKGMWMDHPLRLISHLKSNSDAIQEVGVNRIKEIKSQTGTWLDAQIDFTLSNVAVECHIFSDTIFLTCRLQFPTVFEDSGWASEAFYEAIDLLSLEVVGEMSACCYALGAVHEPPLCYRGAIATGEYFISEGMIVGPAVDEAAEYMNEPQGAIIWLAPSASSTLSRRSALAERALESQAAFPEIAEHFGAPTCLAFAKYTVPLKSGHALNSHVVDVLLAAKDNYELVMAGIREKMSGPAIEIRLKRQNTLAYLEHLSRIARQESHYPDLAELE